MILIPALKQLSLGRETSLQNGKWLWDDAPVGTFNYLQVKFIILHSDDFAVIEMAILRQFELNEELLPRAHVMYGIYFSGLMGPAQYLNAAIQTFIIPDKVEFLALHHAATIHAPHGYALAFPPELSPCSGNHYEYMGSDLFSGFTVGGQDNLPEWAQTLGGRTGYVQGYYPEPCHVLLPNEFANSPITLHGGLFGWKSDKFLQKLERESRGQLLGFKAVLKIELGSLRLISLKQMFTSANLFLLRNY